MQTISEVGKYREKTGSKHPLEIKGQNICDLAQNDPEAAYRLVFEAVDRRGGHEPLIRYRARQSCISKAMAKPLPGAAEDAFLSKELKVNGRKVFKIFPSHIRALQAVQSPILSMGHETGLKEFTEAQQNYLCFIMTTAPRELATILDSEGAEKLRKLADEKINGVWEAAEIEMCVLLSISQYAKHMQTRIKIAGEAVENDRFFREMLENISRDSKQPASAAS